MEMIGKWLYWGPYRTISSDFNKKAGEVGGYLYALLIQTTKKLTGVLIC